MTLHKLKLLISPLLSLFILVNGIALLNTVIPIKLDMLEISSFEIGFITTAFYIGMTLGSFKNASLIIRVGHIRAFAAFASIICVVTLLKSLYYSIFIWAILRCIFRILSGGSIYCN